MELKPELGSLILSELRQRYEGIPSSGVLAGGAVADWFLGLEPNDIDVFVPATQTQIETQKMGVPTANVGMPERVYDPYAHVHCIAWKQLYRVVSSRREGMINTIACEGENLTASRIIAGFDLNATRVGIDLDTERLVWDEEFAVFLKTNQLRISTLFTPPHTAIRYFLKKDRLGCAGDDEVEMEIISEAWNSQRMGRSSYQLVPQFGRMYLEKAKKAAQLGLKRYFSIEPSGYFWTLEPKFKTDFNTSDLDGVIFPLHAPKVLREQRMSSPKGLLNKIELVSSMATSQIMLMMVDMFKGGYVRGQVNERSIAEVSTLLNHHEGIFPLLLGFNLERQFQIKRRFARFAKRHGLWVYGLAEKEATPMDVISDDAFESFISRFREVYRQPLKLPSAIVSRNFLWYSIRELVSQEELMSEGEAMGHCACSYATSVQKGKSMIFSIQSRLSAHTRSTAEIGRVFKDDYMIFQNRSFGIRKAPIGCHLAGLWILASLQTKSSTEKVRSFFKYVEKEDLFGSFKRKLTKMFHVSPNLS